MEMDKHTGQPNGKWMYVGNSLVHLCPSEMSGSEIVKIIVQSSEVPHLKSPRSLSGRFLHFTFQGHRQGQTWWSLRPWLQSICLLFTSWQSNIFGWDIANSKFEPEASQVKVIANIKSDGSHFRPRVQLTYLLFSSWQLDHFWLRYSKLHIWPWKFMVKVMAKFKSYGHMSGIEFSQYVCCFCFLAIGSYLAEI